MLLPVNGKLVAIIVDIDSTVLELELMLRVVDELIWPDSIEDQAALSELVVLLSDLCFVGIEVSDNVEIGGENVGIVNGVGTEDGVVDIDCCITPGVEFTFV